MKRTSMNRAVQVATLGTVVLLTAAFAFGGWAVVTVDDLPEHMVAGQPVTLSFAVRQHGMTMLGNLSPRIELRSGGVETSFAAKAATESGRYTASITAPRAGDWTIVVESGFGPNKSTLLPMRVVAAGAPAPALLADHERGLRLFVAKGCTTCHVRGALGTDGVKAGPELTGRRYVADVVSRFLAYPDSGPLFRANKTDARMPKLGLKASEIALLVSYLNSEVRVSSQPGPSR